MTTRRFDTLLVANRGEIAVRILRTARAHGYRTVAIHSDADRDTRHVRDADDAVRIGPAPAADSYLRIDRIVAAAVASGAQAIHPGYGFLAENADFAAACADAGLVFVGPSPTAIRLMGDKAAAKERLGAAGVPLISGYHGDDQAFDRLIAEAERIGFPIMVKAAAGGGGKGMRLVATPGDFAAALAGARREAAAAFGSDAVILERALRRARHVEVQVLADEAGHVLALGERDCSVQRRHQKVVEEAPAPGLDSATRAALCDAAITAATEIGYVGAGTVEFLLDGTAPAFLEMNTRLQVEHPVTEMVTGVDLVDWQLRIAQGEALTLEAGEQTVTGHAIEARLYAEDPARDFLPQSGPVTAWQPPAGPGVRVDTALTTGQQVTTHYDPLLAKIVAHGRNREEARRRLIAALEATVLGGLVTNRAFLRAVLRHPALAAGEVTTAFLDDHDVAPPAATARDLAAVAGWRHLQREAAAAGRSPGLAGWSNAAWLAAHQRLVVGDEVVDVTLRRDAGELAVEIDGAEFTVADHPRGVRLDGRVVAISASGPPPAHRHATAGDGWYALPHLDVRVADAEGAGAQQAVQDTAGVLTAPMHGTVVSVPAAPGDRVAVGTVVVVVEAMKMEHAVAATVAGTVSEVAAVGAQVGHGDVIARIEPAPRQA